MAFYLFGLRFGSVEDSRQTPVATPASIRQGRLTAAQRRRAELEKKVEEEETLLFEEEEQALLRQELEEVRSARRTRRSKVS